MPIEKSFGLLNYSPNHWYLNRILRGVDYFNTHSILITVYLKILFFNKDGYHYL